VKTICIMCSALVSVMMGCSDDTDPPWQLDHDRIIAVRATPPRVAAGEQATIDALVGFRGAPVAELAPDSVTVESPASLAATVSRGSAGWTVTAPSAEQLAAARGELGLAAGALVPLSIRAGYTQSGLFATKTVWLGGDATNPTMTGVTVDRGDPGDTEIVVDPLVDVPLSIGFDDVRYDVTWLSSCGTMHDFDLPTAYLRVEADDPTSGQLAVVVRDDSGGVGWRIWSIRTR